MNKMEQVIFKYLNNKNLILMETDGNYYFLENENDDFYQIRIRKNDMVCFICYSLNSEIESFFSIGSIDSTGVLARYVEDTLKIKVSNTRTRFSRSYRSVEDTLKIKVSNT